MPRKRTVLTLAFAVLTPGLGHAYLREWTRALMWFGLAVTTVALFVPESVATQGDSLLAVARGTAAAYPQTALLTFGVLVGFNVLDVYLLLQRRVPADTPTCPYCGRERDVDLSFCHWCTTRLENQE